MHGGLQNDFAADACFAGDPNMGVFAVFDGHGPNGRRVANLLSAQLVSTLESELDVDAPMDRVHRGHSCCLLDWSAVSAGVQQ